VILLHVRLEQLAHRCHNLVRLGLPAGLPLGKDELSIGCDLVHTPATGDEGDRLNLLPERGKEGLRHTGGNTLIASIHAEGDLDFHPFPPHTSVSRVHYMTPFQTRQAI
jgi:hypothetical protein